MELGCIRFEAYEAYLKREERNLSYAHNASTSKHTNFKDSTKKDAVKAGMDASKGFMAIKQGKVIEKKSKASRRKV
jgi:hypothetical protein